MHKYAVLLSIPGLRQQDLSQMPRLTALMQPAGSCLPLIPSFPAVTCPVQANMTTGVGPEQHGVVANGFFYREKGEFEMWTAWNECIQAPQIWDRLHEHDSSLTSAVWFPLHCKGAGADYICQPAPIHNPDGSESLWCYTKPTEFYGDLRDTLGHFPLMNFWGPIAGIKSTNWIVDSAVVAAQKFQPRFSYIYLPELDYAAQKKGPNSQEAQAALVGLDAAIGRLVDGYRAAGLDDILWLVASEYTITEVDQVCYPNRLLREAGLISLIEDEGKELLDVANSQAWALVDHQLAHVFVRDPAVISRVADVLREAPGLERMFVGDERSEIGLNHERSGEIVLMARPNAWFAYYYWLDDALAPGFARTVDIHRKPGYDPVELYIDMPSRQTPLNAELVRGSHGNVAGSASGGGVLMTSDGKSVNDVTVKDVDIYGIVLQNFGVAVTAGG
ncbi:MAG: alkaline phosphatase family protein [Planctomycetaceae bacterium]